MGFCKAPAVFLDANNLITNSPLISGLLSHRRFSPLQLLIIVAPIALLLLLLGRRLTLSVWKLVRWHTRHIRRHVGGPGTILHSLS